MIQRNRIDVHSHIVPGFYRDWCLDMGLDTGNLKMPDWSVDQSLAFMDQAGIQTSILSVSARGLILRPDPKPMKWPGD